MSRKFLLGIYFGGIFLLFLHPIDSDGDFFQHVNIGRSFLQEKTFPRRDVFTFTAKGKSYIGYSWGTGIIFYLLYKNIGPVGVNLFVAGVATLTALILFRFLHTITQSNKVSLLTLAISLPVIATRFPTRPEIMTYLFVSVLLLINKLRQKAPLSNLLFPFIILLWASMYSVSLIVGLALLFLFVINQWLLDKRRFLKQQSWFYFSLLVSVPMAFLNGYGSPALLYIFRIRELIEFHGDWAGIGKILSSAPIEYLLTYQYSLLIFFIYLIFFITVLAKTLKSVRIHWLYLLLVLGLIVPFFAARQLPLAVLLSSPLLALSLSQSGRLLNRVGITVALILLVLIIKSNPPGIGEDLETFPKTIVSFIRQHQLQGNVFNTQRIGSFLAYYLYPQIKVFSDTRDDMFVNTTVLQEMWKILYSKERMFWFLDHYNVDIIIADLTEGGSYPYLYLLEGKRWVPVYLDSIYLILIPHDVAKEKNLTIFDAINPFSEYGVIEGKEEEAVKQYQSIITSFDSSFNNQLRLTLALYKVGRIDEAITVINKQTAPSTLLTIQKHQLLLDLYLAKNDCIKANTEVDSIKMYVNIIPIFIPGRSLSNNIHAAEKLYNTKCRGYEAF